jgi:hypothetical protein
MRLSTGRIRFVLAVLALVCVPAFLACGQKNAARPDAAAAAPTQPAVSAAAPPAPSTAAAATPATNPVAAMPSSAPAGAFVADHETGAEVTLVEARRTSGDAITVKWRYRNPQAADIKLTKGGSNWSDPYRLALGAFLIDPVNKKKYLLITDSENLPLASKHGDWQGVTLAPGQTLSAWAKFPAPPADIDRLSITLPGVSPFEDVPIVK